MGSGDKRPNGFTYEIENSAGGVSAPVSVSLGLDPGPSVTDPTLVVGHPGTLDLSSLVGSLATPGLSGDTLTLTAASPANGEIVQNAVGDFIYKPIAPGNGTSITVGYNLMGNDAVDFTGQESPRGGVDDVVLRVDRRGSPGACHRRRRLRAG